MEYIARELEDRFLEASSSFRAVMVTGARQVGKSTMLEHLAKGQGREVVTMDSAFERELARTDPTLFFQVHKPPLLIDEIQKAPELLEPIKMMCDESDERGRFWLTGSQSKKLLKTADDTLAGRLVTLRLFSLSQREKDGLIDLSPLDLSYPALAKRKERFGPNNVRSVFERIWRGGMPEVQNLSGSMMSAYFDSYVDTYLMRDAVDDNGIQDTEGFRRLLRACAALTGDMLNYTALAQSAEVSVSTTREWVKVLQAMGVVYLLEPYSNDELKRLVKTPKLYFCDTGLAAHLSMWSSPEILMAGAASGRFFENYAVMEAVHAFEYGSARTNLTYYRDRDAREIDLVVEEGQTLHPLEIKKAASPKRQATRQFRLLDASGFERGPGGVICMCDKPFPLDGQDCLVPVNIL